MMKVKSKSPRTHVCYLFLRRPRMTALNTFRSILGDLPRRHRRREGKASVALPLEGATQAPVNRQKGFTLLEIMVAVSILAISLLVILDFHSGAMLTSRRAEEITVATMLARQQLLEVKLEIEKNMAKGEFPSEEKTMEGTFDEPHENYKWEATIKKVEIPVPPQPEGEEGQQGMDVMLTMFKMISEKIADAAREITLVVKWEELGDEKTLSATTHIIKL